MKKLNSGDFQEIKGVKEHKNDINLNLWDLDGSSFLLDKNINDLESTATFNNTVLNCNNYSNINIISSKNSKDIIFPFHKIPKNKNKSVNTSFVKYNNFPSERKDLKINNKPKNNVNKNHFNKFKNNSFCNNYKYNDIILKDLNKKKSKKSDEYNNKIKKAKQRLNHSVDYSRKDEPEISLLGYNKYKYNKKQNLNKSLSIETLNNKFNNNSKSPYNNITNVKNNKNLILNNFNNNKHLKKSNSIDCNIYINKNKNIKTKSNANTTVINDNNKIQIRKNQKLNKEKENDIKKHKNKSVSKKSIEDAEKYTHYLAKKKIFSHDYELQNKLKKEQEDRQVEKEMSQCTFKPQLYHNKYNNRIQSQKNNHKSKTIYEKQSQWLNNLKKKKENEREKKMNKEIQGCTFIPQLTTLPKYDSKRVKITNREQMGEENYYNKMKKARQIIQEKNKGDELIERYDERRKKNLLPRSMLTFGNFNQENNNNINEGSINKKYTNCNNINNNNHNWKMNSYSMNNSSIEGNNYLKDYDNNIINDNILNFHINDKINENTKVIDTNGKINNNYIYNNNISNNYIGLNNNNIFNNNINNNFIIDNNNNLANKIPNNYKNNSFIIQNQNSINMAHKNNTMNQNKNYVIYLNNDVNKLGDTQNTNNNKIVDLLTNNNNNVSLNYGNFLNESSNMKHSNINKRNNSNNKNISNNKYINQRDNNNYDFDNNYTDEKFINKIPQNNFINPTIYNEEQEKENMNISTGTVTKANSILSLQKKSSHSLPDRPEFENKFINLNNYKINKTQEIIQTNKNNNFNNSQDEEFNRQKMILMNELHNWNNFDEESNEDD